MQEYMPYIWLAVIAVAIFVEVETTALVAIWFIPSALITAILAFFDIPIIWQIVIFLLLSVLCLTVSKIFFKSKRVAPHTPTNADLVIGQPAIVTEQVCNLENRGLAKVRGQVWSAKSADDSIIEANEVVQVVGIEGVKLVLKKQ